MTHHNTNSDFLIRTARAETEQRIHTHHPSEDTLLALLSGDLANEQRSRLHAHLATCSECHTQWRDLETHLSEDAHSLKERSTVPSFAATIRDKQVARKQSQPWWRSLFETWSLGTSASVALAGSAAALVVAFVVMIPVFQNSLQQARSQIVDLNFRNNLLEIQLNSAVSVPISNNFTEQINTEEMLLAYDWTTLIPYEIETGDDWQLVAKNKLGSRNLWPMLWLLNVERTVEAPLNPGETIWLPKPRE